MDIIELRLLEKLACRISAVNHTTMHGDGLLEYGIEKTRTFCLFDGIDAPFRQSEVDGLCEIEWRGGLISKILMWELLNIQSKHEPNLAA